MKVGDLVYFKSVTRPYKLDKQWRQGLLIKIEFETHDTYCKVFYNRSVIRIRSAQIRKEKFKTE